MYNFTCGKNFLNHVELTDYAFQVLGAYLERASSEEKARFIKDRGFYLLAMQLNHVTPSPELADALASEIQLFPYNVDIFTKNK